MKSTDYYAYISKIRNVNAVYKTCVSLTILMFCIVANNMVVSLFIIVSMGIITVKLGGVQLKSYISLLKLPIFFMIMGSIAIAFEIGKYPIGEWYLDLHYFYLYITKESLFKTVSIICRALGALSSMYMLTLSTPANEIIIVLRKFHVPKLMIELMHMIYRFIFIILDVQGKMQYAAESRLGYVDFKTSIKSFGKIGGNLLIMSLKKANTYYDALESRGYDGELKFLEEDKRCEARLIFYALIYIIIIISLWIFSQ